MFFTDCIFKPVKTSEGMKAGIDMFSKQQREFIHCHCDRCMQWSVRVDMKSIPEQRDVTDITFYHWISWLLAQPTAAENAG